MTTEQMCRDLLARAYRDGVLQSVFYTGTADGLSAGDLTGMANLLAEFLRREAAKPVVVVTDQITCTDFRM